MNNKIAYIIIAIFCLLSLACRERVSVVPTEELKLENVPTDTLENLPMVSKYIGEFPFYVTPPENYHFDGSVSEMNFDEIYHFYPDSSTLSIGGKYYESPILKNERKTKLKKGEIDIYEDSLILAHFDAKIKELGGVETNLPKKYSHSLHSNVSVIDSVRRYAIRTPKGNIWIDLISLEQPRQINYSVIFEGRTSQPVNIIKAERLRYALENYGKVVVYVNFDDGKISLQKDGVKAVEEFVKLMRIDPDLKLSIEGHTDDVGTDEYARRLSYERVFTIVNFMKDRGIKEHRVKRIGHGSTRMVADNNNIENRKKNIRVELIKVNVDETSLRNAIERDGKAVLQINFETGKYIIKPEGQDIVDQIAKLLTIDKKLKLSIEGHTDNVGSAASNKKLSEQRANAVLERLVELGIDRKRLRSSGYGLERPMVPNTTPANREQNRRVEIVKIRQ